VSPPRPAGADLCRVAILVSGSGSNLQALIDSSRVPDATYQVVTVISNRPGVAALARATEAGIDNVTIDHTCYPDREAFDQSVAECLEGFRVDLVVLAGFMRILSAPFVVRFRGRMLNIHPSLLPKYPGLKTHQRALDAGDSEAGCTVHFVTEELDGGPPVLQARVPILPGDDADLLAERVLQQEHRIYPLAVQWYATGRLVLESNTALLDGNPLPPQGHRFDD